MRINTKPAASIAAIAFLFLLIFDLVWPGHGSWLLILGVIAAVAAVGLWWRDRMEMIARHSQQPGPRSLSAVSAFGISGEGLQMRPRRAQDGVAVWLVIAPIAVLAILLFIGGAIGDGAPAGEAQVAQLDQEVSVIDRSGDGEASTLQLNPPATAQTTNAISGTTGSATSVSSANSAALSTDSAESQDAAPTPLRPIVVSAPSAAAAPEEEQSAPPAPETLRTFEYTVEEGDSLYEIALQYDVTVEAIMGLNNLDANSYIHPGDVLKIPVSDDEEA